MIILPEAIFSISAVIHLLGFVLLCKVNFEPPNRHDSLLLDFVVRSLFWFALQVHKYLITDKILHVYLHLKHSNIFTKNRVLRILCSFWAFVLTNGSAVLCATILHGSKDITKTLIIHAVTMVLFVTDIVLFIYSICSFKYLFSKANAIMGEAK